MLYLSRVGVDRLSLQARSSSAIVFKEESSWI